jgi:hypothetical protein
MSKEAKRYTPRFKFQVVMETLKSSKPRSANTHEERTNVMAEATSRMFFVEKATNSVGKDVWSHRQDVIRFTFYLTFLLLERN